MEKAAGRLITSSLVALALLFTSMPTATSASSDLGEPPRNVVARISGPDQVTITWDPPSDSASNPVVSYRLRLMTESTPSIIRNETETASVINGLLPGRQYRVLITAFHNSVGESWPGTTVFASPTAPDLVTNLMVTEVTSTSIALDWKAPRDDGGTPITGYKVFVNGTFRDLVTATKMEIKDLNPKTKYSFAVRAMNGVGSSDAVILTEQTFPPPAPPNKPTNVQVTETTATTISLKWEASTPIDGVPIQSYRIYVNENYVGETGTAGGTRYVITDLRPNRLYLIGVSAFTLGGVSSATTVTAKTTDGPIPPPKPAPEPEIPDPPRNLQTTPIGKTAISLTWSPPEGDVDDYVISFGTRKPSVVRGTTFLAEDLSPSTEYTFSIQARNSVGISTAAVVSTATLFTPAPRPSAPLAPVGLAIEGASTTAFSVTWDNAIVGGAILPATAHWVQVGESDPVRVREHIYTVTGLQPGIELPVSVWSENDMGQGPRASILGRTRLSPAPNPVPTEPRSLRAITTTDASITLDWLAPTQTGQSSVIGYLVTWGESRQSTTVTSMLIPDLLPSTVYTFTVQSINESGLSNPATIRVRTREAPTPTPTPDPGPAPTPTPTPTPVPEQRPGPDISSKFTGSNNDGSLDGDGDILSLQQFLPGRWPVSPIAYSAKDKFLERSSRMLTNADQLAKGSITFRSPSIRSAAIVFDQKTKSYVLRAILKPHRISGSVIVTVAAPPAIVDDQQFEALHASKLFKVMPRTNKKR